MPYLLFKTSGIFLIASQSGDNIAFFKKGFRFLAGITFLKVLLTDNRVLRTTVTRSYSKVLHPDKINPLTCFNNIMIIYFY